jgi:hypothetical protein
MPTRARVTSTDNTETTVVPTALSLVVLEPAEASSLGRLSVVVAVLN